MLSFANRRLGATLGLRPQFNPIVKLSSYGTDLAALKAAINAAAQISGRRLLIDQSIAVSIVTENDPVQLTSGLTLEFINGSSVTWDAFGLPLFWGANVADLKFINPRIYFAGVAATALPAVTQSFYNRLGRTNNFPTRDSMAAIGLFGCANIEIQNGFFGATDLSDSTHLMQRAISISDYNDGSSSKNIRINGLTLDGVTMGVLLWGCDGVTLGTVDSKHWGQLDVTTYAWEIACHCIYVTAQSQNYNVTAGVLVDEGLAVAGAYKANFPGSFKFRRVQAGSVESIASHRSTGVLEWDTQGTEQKPFIFGPIEWWGTTDADLTSAGVINMPKKGALGVSGEAAYTMFQSIILHAPDDLTHSLIVGVTSAGDAADTLSHIDFSAITINYNGSTLSFSQPLIGGSMSNCTLNLSLFAPNWTVSNALLLNVYNGGSNNSLDATTQGPDFATERIVEQDAASNGNFAVFRQYGTSNVRTYGPTA